MSVPRRDLSGRAAELRGARVPFVRARVVLAERPTSAKPGDEAIVLADGTIEGFVGGSCAESTVREAALLLFASAGTEVVRITPSPEAGQPGRRVVHNPCLSGGTLEVYLEAETPAPLVVVAGRSPIAAAVLELGERLGYDLRSFDGTVAPDTAAVVVASHGGDEEKVLRAALEAAVPYVGLVASRRRGAAVVESLGLEEDEAARVRTPAGLDIGAATAQEIALSILAEIISSKPRALPDPALAPTPVPSLATDPVCGMKVLPGEDGLSVEHEGRTVWFCGPGCRQAFVADPSAYPS